MIIIYNKYRCGSVAHLGERVVRNDEVAGSIPVRSTIFCKIPQKLAIPEVNPLYWISQ